MKFPFYDDAPKEVVTSCNLCSSTRYRLIATVDRYGLDAPAAKCTNCGLVFLSYRMTAEAYREFYEGGHYRALLNQLFKLKPITPESLESDQTRYAQRLVDFLGQYMNGRTGGLMLDLGGSVGIVAEKLAHAFNLDATVVEASVSEAKRALDRGLTVVPVPVQNFDANGSHYDLILLCRTVDHLLDIKGALAKIRGWLAPGGLFYVDFIYKPPLKIDHPYLLSPETIQRYLTQAGFKVQTMGVTVDGRHVSVLAEGA